MSNKGLKLLSMEAALMAALAMDYSAVGGKRAPEEKEESPEARERREKCARMAIEKARAKRERKAAKWRKDNELGVKSKEENK